MRGILRKFKIQTEKIESRAGKIFSKWRVLLYSAPVVALMFPLVADAAGVGAAITKFTGAAFKKTGSVAGLAAANLLQGSVEGAAMLAGWILILYQLTKIFADLFSGIFLFLINFLIGVSQYNSFLGAPIVTIGWSVTRDIANMFLVVALLVIAFATILNVNSYQASSLLKQFFFSAILVNFSKMICGVFIDASQVVMMTFVSGFSETAAGNFVKLFQVDKWLQLGLGTSGEATATQNALGKAADTVSTWTSDFFTGIATNIFTAIISFFGMLAILSLDIVLVVRVITLWFLIIAAPIAFVAKVLPVTKGFSSQWWSIFTKQLIAGPLVAFIVWSSLASIAVSEDAFDLTKDARNKDKLFAEANATQSTQSQLAATKISQWENLALYLVPLMIFIMGAKWSVSVAGGAAKSITGAVNGKISGMAMTGVRMFQKQAIGKGQFSAMTQAKKGFSGEGGMATLGMGAVGGFALSKIGGKRGEALSGKIGNVLGDRGRAKTREFHKDVKVAASKVGLGELGHKRHEAHNADADAAMYRERAAKARESGDTSAEELNNRKASEAAKKAEKVQEEIFKADGLIDDKSILEHLKKAESGHGHVSESELLVGKKLLEESFAKKASAEMAKAKAKNYSDRDEKLRQAKIRGASEEEIKKINEEHKWDTARNNEEEQRIERDHGDSKKQAARLMDRYLDPVGASTKHAEEDAKKAANEAGDEAAKVAVAQRVIQKQRDEAAAQATAAQEAATAAAAKAAADREASANSSLHAEQVTVENNYKVNLQNTNNQQAAQTDMARDLSGSALRARQAGASDAEIKVSFARSLQLVHPQERAAFANNLKQNLGPGNPLTQLVDDVHAEINKVTGEVAKARIEERRGSRDAHGADFNLKDFGATNDASGKLHLPPPAIAELAKAIAHDPTIIARFSSATSAHPDVQRAVLHSIETADQALNIVNEISSTVGDRAEVLARVRNLSQTLQMSTDATLKSQTVNLVHLV